MPFARIQGRRVVLAGVALTSVISSVISAASAQHDGHDEAKKPQDAPPAIKDAPKDGMKPTDDMGQMGQMHGGMMHSGMSAVNDLTVPMSREASGTSWQPDSTPIYGYMKMHGRDMLMLHGFIAPRYVYVPTPRGDKQFDAPSWFMVMYSHPLSSRDQIGYRVMLSLDPLLVGETGYPLLFQTGETAKGKPLHDRQHNHDLFSEVSAVYSRRLDSKPTGSSSVSAYFGYPGEPALGPPTFMHRLIALDLADAPLSHHWMDSTHITFGVGTLGVNLHGKVKAEASIFKGREPDENRYNFDSPKFDSYSGRLSWNLDANNAVQVSYGFLKSPESTAPKENENRTTASWLYNRPLGEDQNLTTTLAWGRNYHGSSGATDAFIIEAHYQKRADSVFARVEGVKKTGEELILPETYHNTKFNIGGCTIGYVRDLTHGKGVDTGIGGAITLNTRPSSLEPFYGSNKAPVGFQIFFRIRPSRTRMEDMQGMGGMKEMDSMKSMGGMKEMKERK